MKASHFVKKVRESEPFKSFIKEDPKAYLCSVFFVRDFTDNHNETQVDFYSPKKKVIVSFKVDKKVERIADKKPETMKHEKFIPKLLNEAIKMDIDAIKPTLLDEMHNRGMTYEIEKVLAFLSLADDRVFWNCTGFLKGLGLVLAHIEDSSESVLYMEKKSLFDMLKVIPGNKGKNEEVKKEQTDSKQPDLKDQKK